MVLYEFLTGIRPHDGGDNLVSLLRDVVDNELPCARQLCPNVPENMANICSKALAKNPKDCYESVLELLEDLKR